MKIGAHVSIAGGIVNAPQRAADLGCEVFQMFTRSPQGGPAPKIDGEVVKKFKEEMEKWGQENCYIHAPYYISFASIEKKTRDASIRVIREELERGSLIGAKYVMTHLGSSKDFSRVEALKLVADGVKKIMNGYRGSTKFLLEISAGAGNVIGDTFEELEYIIKNSSDRVGICIDSAHMFASGYDIKTKEGFDSVVKIIERTVGLEKIKLIHANDSMVGLGERKDRHDHIGDGKIGVEGFRNLIKAFPEVDPERSLARTKGASPKDLGKATSYGIDFILETKPDKVIEDIKKLKEMRK